MMVRGAALFLWLAAAAPCAAAAVPAQGQQETKPDEAVKRAAEAIDALDFARLFSDKAYAEGILAHVATLRPAAAENPELAGTLDRVSIFPLVALDRHAEASEISARLLASPQARPLDHGAAVWSAFAADKFDEALGALERAAARLRTEEERSEFLSAFDKSLIYGLSRHFNQAKDKDAESGFRLDEALVALGWPGPNFPAALDGSRREVVEGRLDRGDLPGARSLVKKIADPSTLLQLLVLAKADPLFAHTDREAAIREAIAAYEPISAATLAAAPGDPQVKVERSLFLRSVGRDREAYELLAPEIADMAKVAEAGEDAFWLVNEAAYALISLGRADEAAGLMEKLVALGLEEHPELISMAINRLAILNSIGRHEEGTRLAIELAGKSEGLASLYGHMWIWSEAACGLAASGDAAGAATWLDKLAAKSEDNEAAHMRALLCLDRLDDAETLLIKRLEGDDAGQVLTAVQTYTLGSGFQTPRGKAMEKKWQGVIARPAVQAAVAKVGRIMAVPMSRSYWGEF